MNTDFMTKVVDRLGGHTHWVDRHGTYHHVDYMSQGYALNVILWLEDRAEQLHITAMINAQHRRDSTPLHSITGRTSREWLHATPMVRALLAKLNANHLKALVADTPACHHCNGFIQTAVIKRNGLPMHASCAAFNDNYTKHADERELKLSYRSGLRDCSNQLTSVPQVGDIAHLTYRNELRFGELVSSLQDVPTGELLVLGVYLTKMAEATLAQRGVDR